MAEKILVVDDDLETLRLVGLMLQRQGYEIVAASNGAQAITSAKAELPDLILLDVMMPDMDGYEVTRNLRAHPPTANIPILMFTAKAQVDDKVAGYEAGVDDYLTKPTHPAELTAHVKVLLSRSSRPRLSTAPLSVGQIVGVVSAKGGLGVSSIVINTAVGICQKMKASVIALELRPGQGTWGPDLAINRQDGLGRLLQMKPEEISLEIVERELITLPTGPRVLCSSIHLKEAELIHAIPQIEMVINRLAAMAQMVLIDIGNITFPDAEKILSHCNELLLVIEPHPTGIVRSKAMIEDLAEMGFGRSRLLTPVLVNRVRSDMQLSWTQVQDSLGLPINHVISPAPEIAFQAVTRYIPIILVQPGGLASQQLQKLADFVAQRVRQK